MKTPPAWLWVVALVPTLAVVAVRWTAGPGIDVEDYAQYVLHARAISSGRHYRQTGYIASPINRMHGPAALPPGVPAVLAGEFKVAGEHEWLIKTTMLLLTIGFIGMAGRYIAELENPWLGLAVTALLGLSPGIVMWSTHVQSDLPFCLMVWLLLWIADRPGAWTWRRMVGMTMAGVLMMAFRAVGIAIFPAFLLFALWRRRELGWRGFVPPLAWMMLIVAGVAVVGLPNLARHPGWLTPAGLMYGLTRNLVTYRISVGNVLTYPTPWTAVNDVWHVVALLFLVVGLVAWGRTAGRRLMPIFALVYGTMLMVLPFGEARYAWALFPIGLLLLFRGIAAVADRVRPGRGLQVAAGAALVLAVGAAGTVAASPRPGFFADLPDVQGLFTALRRMNAGSPMRVAFTRPRTLALETGVPSTPLFLGDPDTVESTLQQLCITHVVLGSQGLTPALDSVFRAAVGAHPERFVSVYANPGFTVYRYEGVDPGRCDRDLFQPAPPRQ